MKKEKNYTVTISEGYVLRDADKVKVILDRVSTILSNSYIKKEKDHA